MKREQQNTDVSQLIADGGTAVPKEESPQDVCTLCGAVATVGVYLHKGPVFYCYEHAPKEP